MAPEGVPAPRGMSQASPQDRSLPPLLSRNVLSLQSPALTSACHTHISMSLGQPCHPLLPSAGLGSGEGFLPTRPQEQGGPIPLVRCEDSIPKLQVHVGPSGVS